VLSQSHQVFRPEHRPASKPRSLAFAVDFAERWRIAYRVGTAKPLEGWGQKPQYLGLGHGLEARLELLQGEALQVRLRCAGGPTTLTSMPVAMSMAATLTEVPIGVNSK
jgi:hypothetical protein